MVVLPPVDGPMDPNAAQSKTATTITPRTIAPSLPSDIGGLTSPPFFLMLAWM